MGIIKHVKAESSSKASLLGLGSSLLFFVICFVTNLAAYLQVGYIIRDSMDGSNYCPVFMYVKSILYFSCS